MVIYPRRRDVRVPQPLLYLRNIGLAIERAATYQPFLVRRASGSLATPLKGLPSSLTSMNSPQQVQPHHHDHGVGVGGELSFHAGGAGASARVEADKAVCDPCSPSATGLPAITDAISPNARTILLLGPSQ